MKADYAEALNALSNALQQSEGFDEASAMSAKAAAAAVRQRQC